MTAEAPPRERTEERPRELPVTVIEAGRKAGFDVREIAIQRELLYYLVRRDVLVRYVQTVLGLGWAVAQPVLTMVVFTIFFGRLAGIDSAGVPYPLFSLSALVAWTYFANGVNAASVSVIANSSMLSKVYFPRIFIPLAPLLAVFVDFLVTLGVLAVLMAAYGHAPGLGVLLLPLLIVVLVVATAGVGLWLAALSSRYRDVRYVTPFLVQLLLFVTPVIYAADVVPEPARYAYALNPMVGVIDGFRSALLGTGSFPWPLVGIGAASALALFLSGVRYFKSTERFFADLA